MNLQDIYDSNKKNVFQLVLSHLVAKLKGKNFNTIFDVSGNRL